MQEANMTFKERARVKMDLTVNFPSSYAQIEDVKRLYREIKILWRNNKDLYNYKEKCRMYALLTDQEEKWNEFWEENKYKIGFPLLNDFMSSLRVRECELCRNPFKAGRADQIYCSDNCRVYACRKGLTKNKQLLAKKTT
ncbi:hypothetical protein ES702_07017 [subsurface metagenome]